MQWRHEVSPDWLLARKDCFTASDAVKMIAEIKRARKLFNVPEGSTLTQTLSPMSDKDIARKIDLGLFPVTIGVIAERFSNSNNIDTTSYGAAARGHILEKDFFTRCPESWKHWDDILVFTDVNGLKLGFSPDGFYDIAQHDIAKSDQYIIEKENLTAYALEHAIKITPIEVKSYEPKNYLKAISTPKAELPERYQLAMAGAVIGWEYIDNIVLVFYCPDFVKCESSVIIDGKASKPPHVTEYLFGFNDLIEETKMIFDGAALEVAVALALGNEWNSPHLLYSQFNGGVPINQREWATIDEIHEEWEQNQNRMFGGIDVQ